MNFQRTWKSKSDLTLNQLILSHKFLLQITRLDLRMYGWLNVLQKPLKLSFAVACGQQKPTQGFLWWIHLFS